MQKLITIFLLSTAVIFNAFGQNQVAHDHSDFKRCAAHDVLEQQLESNPEFKERRKAIEAHVQSFIEDPNRDQNGSVIIIPTVFHVIHNGDAVGSNENIADVYLLAQLDQLNDDFRRLNADADNTWSQAADLEIEFCLATEDPNGNPTTGITRHNEGSATWGISAFDSQVKPGTIWDRDEYLNIWSANLSGGLLGYAQFPGGQANTDGVVNAYFSYGSLTTPNPAGGSFGLGRTCTHEIGHWLNMFHIWGDDGGSCNGSDAVADTPNQASDSSGCPSGVQTDGCSSSAPGYMYQNYMDYTNDACMNLFTEGQKSRAQALFAPGGARVSLVTSPCNNTPVPPVADFTPDNGPLNFCGTGILTFSNQSTGSPTSYSWTFSGAGVSIGSSTAQNPVVSVSSSGTLNVSLTVSNAQGNDTYSANIVVNVLPNSDPACQATPCLDFDGGPYIDISYGDACFLGGCPTINAGFEVWENEAYILGGLVAGVSYTLEFCTNYSAGTWPAIITIGQYDSGTNAAVPNSQIATASGCSITFTPSADGDYIAVVSGDGNCGGAENQTDNGDLTFQCSGTAACPAACGATFMDSGGVASGYGNQVNKTYTVCPDNPSCEDAQLEFTFFQIEDEANCGYDVLSIYNGTNTNNANLIGDYCGTNSPGTVTSTDASGCLTVVFVSDQSVTDLGWEANVNCIDDGTCATCPPNYVGANSLTGFESGNGGINNDGDYETDGNIVSTQTITSGSVDYDSDNMVTMNSGFTVQVGATFCAFIDGCNNGGGGVNVNGGEVVEFKRYMNAKKPSPYFLQAKKDKINNTPTSK